MVVHRGAKEYNLCKFQIHSDNFGRKALYNSLSVLEDTTYEVLQG